MKCGRLRSSNCFVVFFLLPPPSPSPRLTSLPVCVYPFETRPFSSLALCPSSLSLSLLVLSFFCQFILQRISTYTIFLGCPLSSTLLLSDSYSAFPDFFISLPCAILSLLHPRDCLSGYFFISFLCFIVRFSPRSLDYPWTINSRFFHRLFLSLIYYFAKFFYHNSFRKNLFFPYLYCLNLLSLLLFLRCVS